MATPDRFELLRADLEAHLARRTSEAMGSLLRRVSTLRGPATALEGTGELATDADAERLHDAAAGIRALAAEVITTAASCIGISERLRAYATMWCLVSTECEDG